MMKKNRPRAPIPKREMAMTYVNDADGCIAQPRQPLNHEHACRTNRATDVETTAPRVVQ
jgi:hypothetical protein